MFEPPRSRKLPCPCGSGRKYKHCHGAQPKPRARPNRRWLGWAVGTAVVVVIGWVVVGQRASAPPPSSGGLGYSLFREGSGSVGGTYASIDGVDMSSLNETQRGAVMQRANAERCPCGCGMTLAQCINTDRACPLRAGHFQRARQLVAQAARRS
ncbi:MAG: SEC-C domain-containing protein [Candidatus Omnitrophica bacterium]|nr:SEC-C domain-containing protein [Candidatus Omnitrophota bacterium]MBI3083846.1 SEC-C domain-containing protein [Candidatus Omnitrophota bacterium]